MDLYKYLDASKTDTSQQIRRKYLKKALTTHPDKGGDAAEFQKVYLAYTILTDSKKREIYDQTGSIESVDKSSIFDESLKVEITEDMIEQDKKIYQNSLDELNDIKSLYTKFKGDYKSLFESLMHSTDEDHERVITIVNDLISKEELPKMSKWSKSTSKRSINKLKSHSAKEAEEAAKLSKEIGVDSFDGLKALIQNKARKQNSYAAVVNNLESKYSGKITKRK